MNWSVLLSTFSLIFLAELGDKTQLAVLTQVCKYRRPWPVFAGASVALVAVTALGALGGHLVARLLPPMVFRALASAAFVVMGVLILREARCFEEEDAGCVLPLAESAPGLWSWPAFGATAALLFGAEMGDKTQLAVLTLAGQQATVWPVFVGGALALVAVTAIGALVGQGLCRLIPQRWLLVFAGVAFVVMGIGMMAGVV